jgi:hypothetical protein
MPLVRLSRDRRWAVCARLDCGERFAMRNEMSALNAKAKPPPPGFRHPGAMLDFVPGWTHDDDHEAAPGGVWTMSRRVRDRMAAGKPPVFRRPPFHEEGDHPSRRDRTRPFGLTTNAHAYPAIIICPACGLQQLADEDVLELR